METLKKHILSPHVRLFLFYIILWIFFLLQQGILFLVFNRVSFYSFMHSSARVFVMFRFSDSIVSLMSKCVVQSRYDAGSSY